MSVGIDPTHKAVTRMINQDKKEKNLEILRRWAKCAQRLGASQEEIVAAVQLTAMITSKIN